MALVELPHLDGRAIKLARNMRDMPQVELARATGLKVHRIWSIENDLKPARPDELVKILKALTTG